MSDGEILSTLFYTVRYSKDKRFLAKKILNERLFLNEKPLNRNFQRERIERLY